MLKTFSFFKKVGGAMILLLLVSTSLRAGGCYGFGDLKPVGMDGNRRFYVLAEYKILHSTHQDNFSGGDIIFTYKVTHSLFLGLGAEYTTNKYHGDNGWRLYNLRFIPIFADAKLFLPGNNTFAPFLQLSEGISFNHYDRMDSPYISSYSVSEKGDYLYTGVGCVLKISKYLKPEIGAGFNGFKMSFNSWDVNPHGFTFRVGLMF